jgi:pre-60S factor REI1
MADVAAPLPSAKCATCTITFESKELMRKHYETDFHLTNVRRRVEGQKILTQSEFRHSNPNLAAGEEETDGTPLYSCSLCKKAFRSIQTLQSHVKSTAHLMRKEQRIISRDSEAASMLSSTSLGSAAIGLHRRHKMHNKVRSAHKDPAQEASVKVSVQDRDEDVDELRCLFCGFKSATVEANLEHLLKEHEFTIPLIHRCTDVKGLLLYLARKVNGLMCLVCGADTKNLASLSGLRDHMKACEHEHLVLSTEYNEFYGNTLDDYDAITTLPNEEGQLIVGSRTVFKRDAAPGLHHRLYETEEQHVERKAITTAAQQAAVALRKERADLIRPELTRQAKDYQRQDQRYQRQMLCVSLRANKLHVKGYDGEGEVN